MRLCAEGAQRFNTHDQLVALADYDANDDVTKVGDDVLKVVAKILLENTRESDIVCRYGGEEFLVFIPEAQPTDLFIIAEKIRKIIEKEVIIDNYPITVTVGCPHA